MWRRRSPSVMIPASLPSAPVMPTQPKPFAVITTIASCIEAPSAISGTASPECITSRMNFSFAPSRPPGWNSRKRSAVKPRLSNSATASASPSASCISEEVVGARLCGQASRACGSSSTTSADFASVLVGVRRHGDQPDAETARVVDQVLQFGGFARPGERHDHVVLGDHAEVAVARLARVHEIGGRIGRREGRGDLARDMAGFAHAGDDQPAARLRDQFHRRDDRLRQTIVNGGHERRDAAPPRYRACATRIRSARGCRAHSVRAWRLPFVNVSELSALS